jgi:hypothetical protein
MKILLDHCVPQPLKNLLTGHEVSHAYELGGRNCAMGIFLQKRSKTFSSSSPQTKTSPTSRWGLAKNWPFWFFGQTTGPNFEFNPLGS